MPCKSPFINYYVNVVYMRKDTTEKVITSKTILASTHQILQTDTLKSTTLPGMRFLSHNHLSDLGQNSIQQVIFKLYQNGQEFYSHPYLVKTDCCHILEQGGPDYLEISD